MVFWKKVVIQAVTPIIASGLIISGLSYFYNDIYNKPSIRVLVDTPLGHNHTVVITNEGRIPATHFFLTLITPQHMVRYPHFFSTLNDTKIQPINHTQLQIGIPRFPHGDGAAAKIYLSYNESESTSVYPEYTAYVTYDQGSTKIYLGRPLTFIETTSSFWNAYWIPIILIAAGLITSVIILFVIKYRYTEELDHLAIVKWIRLMIVWYNLDIFHKQETKYSKAKQVLRDIKRIERALEGNTESYINLENT